MSEGEAIFMEIAAELAERRSTTIGKMFGKTCLKTGPKAFAALYQDEMVFRLGKETLTPFLTEYRGSQNWDPSGKHRPMKDWLQVPIQHQEKWPTLAEQALEFVLNQT